MTRLCLCQSHIYHFGPSRMQWVGYCFSHPLFVWAIVADRLTERMPDTWLRFTLRKGILFSVLDNAPQEWSDWCADDLPDADIYAWRKTAS